MQKALMLLFTGLLLIMPALSAWPAAQSRPAPLATLPMEPRQTFDSAQFNLGIMYDNGEGVTEDDVQAHILFNLAAVSGKRGRKEAS